MRPRGRSQPSTHFIEENLVPTEEVGKILSRKFQLFHFIFGQIPRILGMKRFLEIKKGAKFYQRAEIIQYALEFAGRESLA